MNATFWGRWVFRGYLQGGQNYAGRWRHYSYDVSSVLISCTFYILICLASRCTVLLTRDRFVSQRGPTTEKRTYRSKFRDFRRSVSSNKVREEAGRPALYTFGGADALRRVPTSLRFFFRASTSWLDPGPVQENNLLIRTIYVFFVSS